MQLERIDTIHCANTLGEGVLWDDRSQLVWWTDIQESLLYCYDWKSGGLQFFKLPERLAALGLVEDGGQLLAAFARGFGLLRPDSGRIDWISRLTADKAGLRFNDGRVDNQGRFWCGTMMEGEGQGIDAAGELFCLTAEGLLSRHVQGIKIPNAICWSPDSARMYFADSPNRKIDVFDFDPSTGTLSNRRLFAETGEDIYPDGAVTDRQGFLWNAQWNGHRVVRYAPDGSVDLILPLPVSQPTCVAFGGPALDHLIITSAREGLSDVQLAAQPLAGDLFIYKTPFKGCPSPRFQGHFVKAES